MKLIHRSLLVWLLLLALPFQGLTSASMLACAPAGVLPAAVPAMSHTMASGADGGHCATAQDPHRPQHQQHGGGHGGKAGACSACCLGAAMAPAMLPVLAVTPAHFISIPFHAGHVPSVDLALPERPPRPLFA